MQTTATFLNIDESAFTVVYGLTVLERTAHALERGGVSCLILPKEIEASASKALAKNKSWKLPIHYSDEPLRVVFQKNEHALLLAQPLVIDQKIISQLVENEEVSEKVGIVSGSPPCPPQGGTPSSQQATSKLKEGVKSPLEGGRGVKTQYEQIDPQQIQLAFIPAAAKSKFQAIPYAISDCTSQAKLAGVEVEKIEFPNLLCTPVRDAATKKSVKRALIRSLTKPTDGWVSRNLNRPISTTISRVLAHTPVTPNQFTVVTGLIGLATGVFLALGGYWNWLIGGALFHITSILDGVDGELARLKFKSSPFGQWLDTLVDNLSYLAALAGILIGIFRLGASQPVKIAGILAVVFAVLALGSLYLYLLRFKSGGTLLNVKYSFQDGNSTWDKIVQVAAAFGKRDLFALIFFFLGLIGQMPMALAYVAIMAFFVFAFSVQAHFTASKSRS